jgi:cation diffusion facilitator family transporter
LAVDFADVALHYLLRWFGQKKSSGRGGGVFFAALGYVLLLWLDTPEPALTGSLAESLVQGVAAATPAVHAPLLFGIVGVSEATFGAVALAATVGVTMLRKRVARRLYADSGNKPRRVLTLSMSVAAALLLPLAVWAGWSEGFAELKLSGVSLVGVVLALAVTTAFFDFYAEPLICTRLRVTSTVAALCMAVSFGVAVVCQARWGLTEPSTLTYVAFSSVVLGVYLLFWSPAKTPPAVMPVYAPGPSAVPAALGSSMDALVPFAKHLVKEIWNDRESRRIFFFLFINLMFMFVEMVYGFLTNSLGLIADAFHMMFDCTALAIGLWASVVARWPATEQFSYGYGRVKVLSGFLNGVFLLFIGSFVLFESFNRLLAPPEIKSEKLLIVSVLGLCVNLVGIWAFHDLHGGGEHSGHSHGHSHAHGGHDEHHEKEQENTKEKKVDDHRLHLGAPKSAISIVVPGKAASSSSCDGHSHDHGSEHKHEHKKVEAACDGHSHDHGEHAHGHAEHGHGAHGEKKKHKKKKERQSHHDSHENAHGVYLHILADTLGSCGVIVSAILISLFDWKIADPICSGIISIFILLSTVPLLRDTSATLTEKTPPKLEDSIRKALGKIVKLDNVVGFRDLHVWNCSGSDSVVSINVIVSGRAVEHEVLAKVRKILHHDFWDTTVQISRES